MAVTLQKQCADYPSYVTNLCYTIVSSCDLKVYISMFTRYFECVMSQHTTMEYNNGNSLLNMATH